LSSSKPQIGFLAKISSPKKSFSSAIGFMFYSARGLAHLSDEILSSKLPPGKRFLTKLEFNAFKVLGLRFYRLESGDYSSPNVLFIGELTLPALFLLLDWLNFKTLNLVLNGEVSLFV